jgi:ribosomal protein L16 Arg81 hydroxylase
MDIMNHPVDLTVYPRYPIRDQKLCILGPGDQLYIPQGWWHCVKSLTESVSFSVWFDSCNTL